MKYHTPFGLARAKEDERPTSQEPGNDAYDQLTLRQNSDFTLVSSILIKTR